MSEVTEVKKKVERMVERKPAEARRKLDEKGADNS